MRDQDLDKMPFEQLWLIHEELTRVLASRITSEKQELERRLARLKETPINGERKTTSSTVRGARTTRSKYPKVLAKYFNPATRSQTWSGRGKQPRWLVAALKEGHKLDEFRIADVETGTAADTLIQADVAENPSPRQPKKTD
jgi:DNA-binding protein H-NS